ncbi:hypothetical protein RKD49_001960 [Streptomyces glaucescens]
MPSRAGRRVHGDPLALVAEDGAARRVDRLRRVHRQALVRQELSGVAVEPVLRGDGLRVPFQLGPGARRRHALLGEDVLAVQEKSGVGDIRDGVQPSVVGRGRDDRRQEGLQGEPVAGQRTYPARGRELRRPVDVDVEHVEPAAVAAAQVRGHLRVRLVGRVRQFDEGHPLTGMSAVPALQQGPEITGEVPRGGQGERTASAPALPRLRLRAGGDVSGQQHDQDEKAPTGGPYPPHRFLPVHRPRAPSPGSEAMYTC